MDLKATGVSLAGERFTGACLKLSQGEALRPGLLQAWWGAALGSLQVRAGSPDVDTVGTGLEGRADGALRTTGFLDALTLLNTLFSMEVVTHCMD